jgi:predicted lysophospholipase L1 biosynthesis ABC-type transport system permease subunit
MAQEYDEVAREQKRISSRAMVCALILGGLLFLLGERAVAKGLVLGTCFSILNFYLLGKSIPMALGRTRRTAGFIGLGSLLVRYGVLAVPLVVAVQSASFNFVAAAVGIFAVQIATLFDYIVLRLPLGRKSL